MTCDTGVCVYSDIWRRGGGGGRGGRAGGEGQRDKMEDHQTFPKTKGETDYRVRGRGEEEKGRGEGGGGRERGCMNRERGE